MPRFQLSGPDFLEELADRQAANGFNIEADQLRQRAKEWLRDKQTIDGGTPVEPSRPDGFKAFTATLIEADTETNRLVLQPDGEGSRRTTLRYHLIPLRAA